MDFMGSREGLEEGLSGELGERVVWLLILIRVSTTRLRESRMLTLDLG